MKNSLEVSIVIPCLNEADTLAICIQKAAITLKEKNISGEIIVADNGSTDESISIAQKLGVRIVNVKNKGYGSALMAGIAAAQGEFIIMGDADDSYDFREIEKFVLKLREGYDLVQGCRLPAGGGNILPGAMPISHRYIGNPMFTLLARIWFKSPINDIYCGMRGFKKSFYEKLNQKCTGMEFATEMIIKASINSAKISEVPITLHPDGRRSHPPHLKTFRDGWRTLRFFLLFSPNWLFLFPGALLIGLGTIAYFLALPAVSLFGIIFDLHTLLFGTLSILSGCQLILFAVFAKTFAVGEGLMPPEKNIRWLADRLKLEHGILIGGLLLIAGIYILTNVVLKWKSIDFGHLDYASTMRLVIPGALLVDLGIQVIFSCFFLSILTLRRK